MFTKPSWLRSPSLHDAAAVIVIVRDSTHLQAISLLTLTMKTETLGFHKFYCWFATDIMAAMLGDQNKAISSVKFFFFIVWSPYMAALSRGCKPRMGGFPLFLQFL